MDMRFMIPLVAAAIVAATVGVIVYKVKKTIRGFSREFLGTDSLKEGFDRIEQEYATQPKSVSAMTGLCLPQIKRDFPEFQYDEMKGRAENVLTSYLMSIDQMNVALLKEGSRELKDHLEMRISSLRGRGEREHYQNIRIHRTEIADYKKRDGRCTVVFQSSLQYQYAKESEDVESSSLQKMTQARFNTELVYIQDRDLVEDERDLSLGINCPNCGAPISGVGSKVCEYCGTPVVELNIYAWTFHKVEELS